MLSENKLLQDDDITREEEGLVFNPYNPDNIEITLNQVQSILTKYGVPDNVHNLNLYRFLWYIRHRAHEFMKF